MKTVSISPRSRDKLLHIEAPGCIVNVQIGLTDRNGRSVTRVDVYADGDRFSGEPQWWVEGKRGKHGLACRIIRTTEGEG